MDRLPISLVVITRDEQHNILRCLASAPFVSDIVVLDSGSKDKTCELAKEHGARVFVESWRGYSAQKKRATELAKWDWVLSLDADEALSPELAQEITRQFEQGLNGSKTSSYNVPRRSFYMGRWINHGGWYPDFQIRLFHRRRASWIEGHVHERVTSRGDTTEKLHGDLLHYPFGTLRKQIDTNNEYSSLASRDLFDRGKRFSVFMLIVKPTFKFLECYIWKRGFLDGLPGFIIAVGAAYSMFLKWAKLWEIQTVNKSKMS